MSPPTNWLAVLAATALGFLLGGLWYSPILFVKPWLAGIGKDESELGSPAVPLVLNFVMAFVASAVIAALINGLGIQTAGGGAMLGFILGAGLVASSMASDFAFNRQPFSLLLIEAGYRVVYCTLSGAVLGAWR